MVLWYRGISLTLAVSTSAITMAVLRQLPTISHARLLECEAALLETVEGDVRHHWYHVYFRLVARSGAFTRCG